MLASAKDLACAPPLQGAHRLASLCRSAGVGQCPTKPLLQPQPRSAPHGLACKPTRLRRTAALGYDHALSKRTDIYAVYLYDKLSTSGSGKGYTAGIRHAF
jgi:hypothetical protein